MPIALRYAVRSDKGLVRGNNEDSVYAGPRLLAIADGMGGHAGGEVASKIVISTVEDLDEDRPIEDLITWLRDTVQDANDSLSLQVQQNPKLEGMGTTLTALRFVGGRVGLVHVGDSRAYLLRAGELSQITHDDTYVQSLVDVGRLTLEEAAQHPRKSVILRALNGTEVSPDVSIREAKVGDRYLLCTDGLTDVVRAETLREALSEGDPQECADSLVALALRGGGPDNVTVIVADVVEGRGDEIPVVAGAVVDSDDAESPDTESPAGRAAGLQTREPAMARPAARKERRWTRVLLPLVIALVLVGAGFGTWTWTQHQYFVGRQDDTVVVFKGVDTAIGPLHFYSVVERSAIKFDDLRPVWRTQVEGGITARSRADADAILARLMGDDRMLPVCVTPSPTPTVSPTPTRTTPTTPRTTPKATAKTTPKTTAKATARPTVRATAKQTATAKPTAKASPTPSVIPSTLGSGSASSPEPTVTPVPGTDCREVK